MDTGDRNKLRRALGEALFDTAKPNADQTRRIDQLIKVLGEVIDNEIARSQDD